MAASHIGTGVVLLVLAAGVLHATWNAIAKAIDDAWTATGLIGLGSALGAGIALPFTGLPAAGALGFLVASTLVHFGYLTALMQAYRLGDFGHSYPIARGTAPLLVCVGAWFFAGQSLQPRQVGGVVLIAVALIGLVVATGRIRRSDAPATIAALVTGCTIAAYTLLDGLGVRHAHNPYGYIALLLLAQGVVFAATGLLARRQHPALRSLSLVSRGVAAGLLSLLAYGIVIWAQARSPFALVSALRETSVISAAVIAALVFKESFGWRRLPAAAAVVAGILLIAG